MVTIWIAGEWLGRYVHPRGANFPKIDGLKSGGKRESEGSDEDWKRAELHLDRWRSLRWGFFLRELLDDVDRIRDANEQGLEGTRVLCVSPHS